MICATSNRRHLTKEIFTDNSIDSDDEEIHPSDLNSDLLSLYDRFGIHIHLYQNSQIVYLELVNKLLSNISDLNFNPEIERMALNWSISRASRSGRTAKQFVNDYVGKSKLELK
jgi:predicted AAA+ superfamily ATPase